LTPLSLVILYHLLLQIRADLPKVSAKPRLTLTFVHASIEERNGAHEACQILFTYPQQTKISRPQQKILILLIGFDYVK